MLLPTRLKLLFSLFFILNGSVLSMTCISIYCANNLRILISKVKLYNWMHSIVNKNIYCNNSQMFTAVPLLYRQNPICVVNEPLNLNIRQELEKTPSGSSIPSEFANNLLDMKLTPQLSYSPNMNPSFSPNFPNHQLILPRQNFYHQIPNPEDNFSPSDQVSLFFAEANFSTQPFNMGHPNPPGKSTTDNKTKGKNTTAQRGRKKKETSTTQPTRGKRQMNIETLTEPNAKKLKEGTEDPSDLVNSLLTPTAETGLSQSR